MKRKSSKKAQSKKEAQHQPSDILAHAANLNPYIKFIGWWGFYLTGTTPLKFPFPPPIPPPMYLRHVVFVGRMFLDGEGNASSYFTVNHNGYVGEGRADGTYQVNSRDGVTGSIKYPPSPGLQGGATLNFVLTDNKRELFLVTTEPAWPDPPPNSTVEPFPGVCLFGVAMRD